jgi:hypothetical protein
MSAPTAPPREPASEHTRLIAALIAALERREAHR